MIKNIDLINLLKDCPQGMPLDCVLFDGSVTFNGIVDDDLYPIEIKIDNDYEERLNKYGGYNNSPYCKCVIFPKGKTSWDEFQRPFKDGDILYIDCNDNKNTYKQLQHIFILKEISEGKIYCYCYIDKANTNGGFEKCCLTNITYSHRFATEEEKQRLFDAIKANGYKWNDENKTLEKLIVPKFKVGDSVQSKTDNNDKFTITNIDNNKFYYGCGNNHEFMIPVIKQDNWELVPNKFDPKTLKPFDKVLVRFNNTSIWVNAFFGFYDIEITKKDPFVASGISWTQCIPYEGNEHLLGTYEDCDEYYKNWEE